MGQLVLGGMQTMPYPYLYQTNGSDWSVLGGAVNGQVRVTCVHQDKLIIGGAFTVVGSAVPASCVAAWDGFEWSSLGDGVNGPVFALSVYGDQLAVGGAFTEAGGEPSSNLAFWDGETWSRPPGGTDGTVLDLTDYDGRLIVGGSFEYAGGVEVNNICSWYEGEGWSALGTGTDGTVRTLCVWDTSLYVGGEFLHAGGHSSARLARWDKWEGNVTSVDDPDRPYLPHDFILFQNYPNPFNPRTAIPFALPRRSEISLRVYNILGQEVARPAEGLYPAGNHRVIWEAGEQASGIYFYRLEAGDLDVTRKMILLK
jgi:hypothetical protein